MSDFNPYAAPETDELRGSIAAASDVAGPWRKGRVLVMAKTGELPPRCVACNAPAIGRPLKRSLTWHPAWWYLLLLINLLVYLVVALIIRKTAVIRVGLCDRHRGRRRMWIALAWSLVLLAIVVPVVMSSAGWNEPLMFVGLIPPLLLAAALIGIFGARVVYAKRIDDHHAWIGGVCPAYLAALPSWESGSSPG